MSHIFCLPKIHKHNTHKCIHLKDTIENLIGEGRLSGYTQENRSKDDHEGLKAPFIRFRRRNESPHKKWPPCREKPHSEKTVEDVEEVGKIKDMIDDEDELIRGKGSLASITKGCNFIASIIWGFWCPKTPSKGTLKRKINEMMALDKKGETFNKEKP